MRRMNVVNRKQALKVVKELDAFPKIPESYVETSASGGGISIIVFLFIVILIISEIMYYTNTELKFEYEVDKEHEGKLNINIDMTIAMPCKLIGADVLDLTGQGAETFGQLKEEAVYFTLTQSQLNYLNMIHQINNYIKNEYHAIHHFLWKTGYTGMATAMPPRDVNDDKIEGEPDGCRVYGQLMVNKVAGNFHVTAGKIFNTHHPYQRPLPSWKRPVQHHHIPKGGVKSPGQENPMGSSDSNLRKVRTMLERKRMVEVKMKEMLLRHKKVPKVTKKTFGITPVNTKQLEDLIGSIPIIPGGHAHMVVADDKQYNFSHRIDHFSFGTPTPGVVNPLDGDLKVTKENYHMFQYFIQVVPTNVDTRQATVDTYQYAVTEKNRTINHSKGSHGVPGIFVKYDLSALKVKVKEVHKPYSQFLVRLCGIIGGIFATSGMLHNLIRFLVDVICCRFKLTKRDKATLESCPTPDSLPRQATPTVPLTSYNSDSYSINNSEDNDTALLSKTYSDQGVSLMPPDDSTLLHNNGL